MKVGMVGVISELKRTHFTAKLHTMSTHIRWGPLPKNERKPGPLILEADQIKHMLCCSLTLAEIRTKYHQIHLTTIHRKVNKQTRSIGFLRELDKYTYASC